MNQPQPIHQNKQILINEIICPKCNSKNFRKDGIADSGYQTYYCKSCTRRFTPKPEELEILVNPKLEYLKDCWDCRALGIQGGVGKSSYKLDFTSISQKWLKDVAKKFTKVCLSTLAFSSVQERLYALRKFSSFLRLEYYGIEAKNLSRSVITDFTIYLKAQGLASATRYKILSDLKVFLEAAY
ncbi:phage integrase SAM-like domain-containing protein [Myxosarcina sp. GI1]|uniref:IS1/IS1595 family N-terminal zinc-binding domain-containing protein n=1 Tax=Myxosarcina sp. GI1 TaxID=1541065 RepID=UPI0006893FCB|nr:phage integrase SAM-like domain-containing protein [Myxosarcina sp. GI1]